MFENHKLRRKSLFIGVFFWFLFAASFNLNLNSPSKNKITFPCGLSFLSTFRERFAVNSGESG